MSQSFIVPLWERIFRILRYVSIFEYIRRIKPFRGSHGFVEVWVLGNLFVSLVCTFFAINTHLPIFVAIFILAYSFIRVFEISVYQINMLLFDQYKNPSAYKVKSYRRLVILLFHNYVEIIFWFATSYSVLSYTFGVFNQQGNLIEMVLFSFMTMITFGSNNMIEISNIGHIVIVNQAIVALFMTTICIARVIGLLPNPKTMDETEEEEQTLSELKIEIIRLEEKIDKLTHDLRNK